MDKILQSDAAAKLPVRELTEELHTFLEPLADKATGEAVARGGRSSCARDYWRAITDGDGDGKGLSA
jgi:hypothetical protein